ncbi:hypothetical protein [Halovivax gelatinilyticus]|uniref:hypothetical protein n=1 Tax=Halovivax gelatinilyticus TaxID=2961597 RepID=UPI0020CA8E43|nr:hypothetical protein [Halovivax gelatinilyticus]
MVISTDPAIDRSEYDPTDLIVRTVEDAVVYGDVESETVLHEGGLRILANGWIELDTGRLLSPSAVHHVDVRPPADERDEVDA